ncbi:MAG: polysaccharide deacetylase [Clostridiales bacterium]|uniref:polysaccharide deacetylase family protein n=1 Tax=Clostridium sp. N3C TaxID=1776758 RepID=UPI00092E18D1|nr:polysaccharide deacetylase family protein [Clostridium sp. N3C]NLZ49388.1 polysaccharide deacetylase [Clostridiales bacterium]SCN23422.1 putative polysaccharide deacetylase PdaA precursor [Clostridium sp. N3C]
MKKKRVNARLLIAGIIFFTFGSLAAFTVAYFKSYSNNSVNTSATKAEKENSNNSKIVLVEKKNDNKEVPESPIVGEEKPEDLNNNKEAKLPSEKAPEKTVDENSSSVQDISKAKEVMNLLKTKVDSDIDKKVAYLTFDDGPSTTVTPLILDILKENNIKATFFVLGSSIDKSEKSKELLKRIDDEGHTIGNHTYSHDYNYLYPNRTVNTENFMADIKKNNEAISRALGKEVESKIIRLPGGHGSWKGTDLLDKHLEEQGYVYIDWNSLIGDSEGIKRNKDQLIARFNQTRQYVPSNNDLVVLMHDTYGKEETAKALPEIINILKSEGYEFSTLE